MPKLLFIGMSLQLSIAICLFHAFLVQAFSSDDATNRMRSNWNADILKKYHSLKSGGGDSRVNDGGAIWYWTGQISNPNTGKTIALIEGVEHTKSLAFLSKREKISPQTFESKIGLLKGLEVSRSLGVENWEAVSALVSHKFFAFYDPLTKQPMHSFKFSPSGKKKPIMPFHVHNQIITHLLQPESDLIIHSEMPKGEIIRTNAQADSNIAKRSNPFKFWENTAQIFNLSMFISSKTAKKWRGNKWIGFGPTPPPSMGCRECYSYVSSSHDSTNSPKVVTYQRFGEYPFWYAPGKTCVMNLKGTRVKSKEDLPQQLLNEIRENVKNFDHFPTNGEDFKKPENTVAVYTPIRSLGYPWWQIWKRL